MPGRKWGNSECLVESGGSSDGKAGDRINLSKIDAISETANNVAFTFIGTEKLSKKAGELRYSKKLSNTHFYGNINGDGQAGLAVHLDDPTTLAINCLVL